MRVCTITCQNADNYGARLQTYALATYLKKIGHEVNVIDYRPDYMTFSVKTWYWPGASLKMWVKLVLQMRQRVRTIRRHSVLDNFSRSFIPLTSKVYNTIEDLRNNPPQADIYIAGSDQIWNTTFRNGTDEAYYLDFGLDETKRVSYAASFATLTLREGTEEFVKTHLCNFDSLSVREVSGIEILSSLGFEGKVVVDPIFLISAEDYNNITPNIIDNGRYILVYDIMRSGEIKQIAKRLAKLHDCKIYSVSPYKYSYADRNYTCAEPGLFVNLIKNATCLVCNSFHGIAFALLYCRKFFVIRRDDGLNERMIDLLDRYGLLSQMIDSNVTDEELTKPIQYENVKEALQRDIMASQKYLAETTCI